MGSWSKVGYVSVGERISQVAVLCCAALVRCAAYVVVAQAAQAKLRRLGRGLSGEWR